MRTAFVVTVLCLVASSQALEQPQIDGCSICKTVVGTVAGMLDQELSVIQQKLDMLCARMGPIATICKDLVDKDLPKIVKWLEDGKNEEEICQELTLCPKTEQPRIDGCSICLEIVKVAATFIDKDESEIEAEVDKVCDALGPLSSICKGLVAQYLPEVVQWLKDGANEKEVCQKLGLCDAKKVAVRAPKIDGCSICMEIVGVAAKYIDSSEQEIEQEVDKLCDDLGFLSSICKSAVAKYLPEIIQWLKDGKNEKEICSELGFCSTMTRMVPLVVKQKQEKTQPNIDPCSLCKTIVHAAKGKMGEPVDQAKKELKEMCDQQGGSLAAMCKMLIDQDGDKVLAWLKQGMSEQEICHKLGLCLAQLRAARVDGCTVCVAVVKKIGTMLEKDEATIEADMDKFCDMLGGLSSVCKSLVDKELKNIIAFLEDGAHEKEVCTKLHLCQ